jgi:hypothetical protein
MPKDYNILTNRAHFTYIASRNPKTALGIPAKGFGPAQLAISTAGTLTVKGSIYWHINSRENWG